MASPFADNLLTGKTALISGGGSGINQCIAQTFAAQGAAVVLVSRTQEKLDKAAGEINDAGGRALGVAADVRDYDALAIAATKAADFGGGIDIVVAGAAGNFPAPALGMSANGFKAVVDIDLLGSFNIYRAAFEHLNKPGASLIAITATHAWIPTPLQAHVCAAKAGVDMMVKTLALEWGPSGVRVNSIAPGPVDDTEGMDRLTPNEEIKQKLINTLPIRRYATKQEIADIALFLCSGSAGYITGATIAVDGGQALVGSGGFTSSLGG